MIVMVLAEIGPVATNGDALIYGTGSGWSCRLSRPTTACPQRSAICWTWGCLPPRRVFLRNGRDLRDVMGRS